MRRNRKFKISSEKFRIPEKASSDDDFNPNVQREYVFFDSVTGESKVINHPDNIIFTYDEATGELSVEDPSGTDNERYSLVDDSLYKDFS
ncbi:hypothetical protein Molly5_58 [Maribacter phage Molly_5]|uniref:Uncharacterized protein n=2 Tax=Mollyvirus TaxID=2948826 RepID=A0A8E4UY26_9CAUD|nr:hypothetical protein M1M29_gp058 [Maribacter phage Molly_1]YP_010357305.1 hypothetical protein M1M30_gp056 [Maribacter phage Colly_1]QQO97742.1 hypothetical protein Molly2_58 [Maribacter phage Molly_2]QQO97942.1 hypothetical protein Molly3_58 [Maribacter phage Molly_3]QQO98142.1 hypothetical protein Molly4_58 [Maribacter phage Molly_4]QQO98342.1 hypothetical protein Molly5_58 [Maribacter phage Molly_5]QQO97340.1 hypothetical protein Colly1_56 [Maribacter phage Colly_1]